MGLLKNSLTYGYNFNITATGPIDSRMRVEYIDDLTNTSTWNIEGKGARVYDGMLVVVLYKGNSRDKGTDPCGDVWVLPDSDKYTLFDDGTIVNEGGWKLAGGISYSPGSGITFTENSTGGYDINVNLCAGSGITLTEGDNGCIKINNNIYPSSGITVYVNEDDNGYVITSNLCAGSGITIEDGDDGCLKINSNIQAGSGLTITEGDDGELILDVNNQYCPGSGITFEDGEECDTINANTGLITIDDILCTQDAPIEALDIWSGDTIPSGTTLQEILIKLLCNVLYPKIYTQHYLPNLQTVSQKMDGIYFLYNNNKISNSANVNWKICNGLFNCPRKNGSSNGITFPMPDYINANYNITRYNTPGGIYDENGQEYPVVVFSGLSSEVNITTDFDKKTYNNVGKYSITFNNFEILDSKEKSVGYSNIDTTKITSLTKFPIGRTIITHKLNAKYSKPIVTQDGWNDKTTETDNYGGWSNTSKPIGVKIWRTPKSNTNERTYSDRTITINENGDMSALWDSSICNTQHNKYYYSFYSVYDNKSNVCYYGNDVNVLEKTDIDGNEYVFENLNRDTSNNGYSIIFDFMCINTKDSSKNQK